MSKWDKILIAVIVIISLVSIGVILYNRSQAQTLYGVIEVNGEEIDTINLLEVKETYTKKIENHGEYNIIEIQNGSIQIIDASCPDKDCVKIGELDAAGKTSVCLPNNVVIRVESPKSHIDDIDGATY